MAAAFTKDKKDADIRARKQILKEAGVMKTDVSAFPYQQAEFAPEDDLLAYVRQAKALGLFETGVSCDDTMQALTLVTCTYEWEGARNVVVAVKKSRYVQTKCSLCICWDLCSIIYFEYLLAKGQSDVDNLRT